LPPRKSCVILSLKKRKLQNGVQLSQPPEFANPSKLPNASLVTRRQKYLDKSPSNPPHPPRKTNPSMHRAEGGVMESSVVLHTSKTKAALRKRQDSLIPLHNIHHQPIRHQHARFSTKRAETVYVISLSQFRLHTTMWTLNLIAVNVCARAGLLHQGFPEIGAFEWLLQSRAISVWC
jgi:hypothetical protein